jgi:hypothetical protein
MSLSGAGFGGGGPGGGGQQANQTPRDAQTLASQLALVTQIQAGVQDETTLKMLDFTANNIKALQNGEQPQGMRQLMQTLGPGAFGGGPGGGGFGGGFGGGRQGGGQNGQAVQGGGQGGQQGGRRNRGGN